MFTLNRSHFSGLCVSGYCLAIPMLTEFFFKLKEGGVPVTIKEFLILLRGVAQGVADEQPG